MSIRQCQRFFHRLGFTLQRPRRRAQDLKEFFSDNQDRLVRVFLPPYFPELNPIESVWRITRRTVTHNRYFASVKELETALVSYSTK